MKNDLEKLLNLNNKDFILQAFKRIQDLPLSDAELSVLTNVDHANDTINAKNKYTYPIIKEVPIIGDVTKEFTHVKGNRRYSNEKVYYQDKAYILCNDWYYPSEGKKNTKDTRTKFLEWIEYLEHKYDSAKST